MKHSPKQLIAAAVLAALGLAAVAQTPAGPAPGAGPRHEHRMDQGDPARMQERMQEYRQARMARRLAQLKETLQITPAQEGAWTAFTASRQASANWKRPDRAELARLTTPERLDRMKVLRTERMARIDQRAEATKVFYAALNPIQKRVFDLETARRGQQGGDGGRGGYRGHQGHHGHHGMGR